MFRNFNLAAGVLLLVAACGGSGSNRVARERAVGREQLPGQRQLTVTTITPTRVVGIFTFTAPAIPASTSPATETVTSGAFDVTV